MKFVISQEEFDEKINKAIDIALLPLLEELQTLGVSGELIQTAMRNVTAKEIEKAKNDK